MRYKQLNIIFLSLSIISCNLFNTREPENPVSDNQTLNLAFTKDLLFDNLKTAIEQKNIQEYEKLFSDSTTHSQNFTFVPNQSAGARYVAVFSIWNKNSEVEYFRNAITTVGDNSSIQLQITSVTEIGTNGLDSAQYSFDYSLFVPHHRNEIKIQQFVGRSEISMSPDKNAIWRIYRWIDFETKKDSSWSDLKGQFAK